ncbi:MAG: hypothetical protein U9Q91_03815 [Candidatus Marinimicrobia bacterium]|nr:hypothetical protein [Candidatus Neomarinimicrobiota bacterium]
MGLSKEQIEGIAEIFLHYIDVSLKEFENSETTAVRTRSVIINDKS